MLTAKEVADILKLAPLEGEGGLYRQTYLSRKDPHGPIDCTVIYYLLTARSFSHLHQLTDDEVYHFYMGSPVELVLLYPDGHDEVVTLGTDLAAGQVPQAVVPAGVWQGSALKPGGDYALLGTTMSPGYGSDSYTHGDRETLIARYPGQRDRIERLTGQVVAF